MRGRRAAAVMGAVVVVAVVAVLGLAGLRRVYLELSYRLNVEGRGVTDPPGQVGVAWDEGLVSAAGDRLAVRFPGAERGGDEPCGAYYIGLVGATMRGLRVTVITIPHTGDAAAGDATSCPARSTPRCAEVRLPYPPDGRLLYDGVGGASPPVATAGPDEPLCDQLVGG